MLHKLQQLSRDQHNDSEFGKLARDMVRTYIQQLGGPYPTARFMSGRVPDGSGSVVADEILKLYSVYPNDQEFGELLRRWLGPNC
jgi:hypothetical protein